MKSYFFLFLNCIFLFSFTKINAMEHFKVTIKDGVFTPSFITVKPQQRFRINVKNIGLGPAEFENLSLRVEKVLGPDVESFVIVPPLKPGKYHFIDEFHTEKSPLEIRVH